MKNEMEKLKTVKPPLVIQPMLEEKQEEEEEEELDECFFDAVNNLELLSEAPPDPRPTSTAALPPSSSGQPSQDFPSSPGSPSSPTFSKAHLPSFPTPCPGLPSSPDLFSTGLTSSSNLFSSELPSSPDLFSPELPASPSSSQDLSSTTAATPSLHPKLLYPRTGPVSRFICPLGCFQKDS